MRSKFSRTEVAALALTVFALLFIFGSFLKVGALNWDDDSNIFKNPYYRDGIWRTYWFHPYFGLYIPVTTAFWHILYALGAATAWPYRAANLILHLGNFVLVFSLLLHFCRTRGFSALAALAGAAFFALHPMQVQAVAWISGGRDLLSSFFALSSLAVFFIGRERVGSIGASFLLVLAIFSKPNAVAVAAAIPLMAFFLEREKFERSLYVMGIGFAATLASAIINLGAQRDYLTDLHWWQRLFVMGDAYSFYLQKLFIPFPLSANYNRIPELVLATWEPYLRTLILILGTAAFAFWARRRSPMVALFAAVWATLLLPVSGLVPFGYQRVSTTADHYHYLPMLAVAAIITAGVRVRAVLLFPLILILATLSWQRSQVWRSNKLFFDDMAAYAPKTYSTAMGQSVIKCEDEGAYQAGIAWIKVALDERPDDMMALSNLAYCLFNSKDFPSTVSLLGVLERVNIPEMEARQPNAFSSFLASVGSALYEVGREAEGFQLVCHAYRLNPNDRNNKYNLPIAADLLRKKGMDPTCLYPFTWPLSPAVQRTIRQ